MDLFCTDLDLKNILSKCCLSLKFFFIRVYSSQTDEFICQGARSQMLHPVLLNVITELFGASLHCAPQLGGPTCLTPAPALLPVQGALRGESGDWGSGPACAARLAV